MKDIESICAFLGRDFTQQEPTELVSPLLLTEDEETCLIYILSSCIKMHVKTLSAKLNRVLIESSLKLIEKYITDFSMPHRLAELIAVTRQIPLEAYVELRLLKSFEELFETLCRILSSHSDLQVLEEVSATFDYFLSEVKDDDINPLVAVASKLHEEFVASLFELMFESMRALKDENMQDGIDLEIYQPLLKAMGQLQCLSMNNRNFFCITSVRECSFEDGVGCYAFMITVIELALQTLKADSGPETSAVCVELVSSALNLQKIETMCALYVTSTTQAEDRKQEETDSLSKKIKRLVDFCEVLVASSSGLGIRFPISLRYASLQILLVYYPALLGGASEFMSHIKESVAPELQCESTKLVSRILELLVSHPPECTIQQFLLFKEQLFSDIVILFSLAKNGYNEIQFAAPVLQWAGFPDSYHDWQVRIANEDVPKFPIVGDMLSELCMGFLEHSMNEMLEISQETNNGSIDACREYAEHLFVLLLDTIQNSMHMYITAQCPNASTPARIFTTVCIQLKHWLTYFKKHTNKAVQGLLGNGLVRLMQRGTSKLIEHIASYEHTVEQARLDTSHMLDNTWLGHRDTVQATLTHVNELWKLWSTLGESTQLLLLKDGSCLTLDNM